VLPSHALLDARHVDRFRREARAAARLHHTNIVPVYGVGHADGLHYYVMQFIQGQGLDAVLDELRRLRPGSKDVAPPDTASSPHVAVVARSLLSGQFTGAEREEPPSAGNATPPGSDSSVTLPGQPSGTPLSRGGRSYWRSVARIGVQVAEALAY